MQAKRAKRGASARQRERWGHAPAAFLTVAALLALAAVLVAGRPAANVTPAAESAAPAAGGYLIAIDPGHGGDDVGAEGLGFYEKDMTWATAQALAELLRADGRFIPFLTKTEEMTLQPKMRAAVARLAHADLLLSIHGNADPVYGASGFECYPVPPGRAQNDESLRFGGCLADAFAAAGATLRGVGGMRYLYYDENDQKQIFEVTDTEIHTDPTFGVLEYSPCPAVLAEQCFITNADDVAAFAGADGCQAAAGVYYRAICAYYALEPVAGA